MSRFLLATWDGGGTIPPELGLAAELVARGHEVVVLSDDTVEQEALSAGATFTPWRRAPQARARDAERALIRDWEVRNPSRRCVRSASCSSSDRPRSTRRTCPTRSTGIRPMC